MGEAIEQGGGHLGVTKDGGPFTEAQVGGDHDAGAFVKFAQQVEQQGSTRGTEREVAQFIKDHEVELGQAFGDLSGLALGLFLFEGVDQFDGREEADLSAVMLDGLDTECRRDMGFSGAWATNQDDVLSTIHELAAIFRAQRRLAGPARNRHRQDPFGFGGDVVQRDVAELIGVVFAIAVGVDADIAIWDPNISWTISNSVLHHNVDYTPYEGMELRGRPITTILRGDVVWDDGIFSGSAGAGQFLRCERPQPARPARP